MGFAYPLYVVFLLAPTITFPFLSCSRGFDWLFIPADCLLNSVLVAAVRWRVSSVSTGILIMLTLGTLPVVQGIKLEQLSLARRRNGCRLRFAPGRDSFVLAGVLLAFATIKPQLVLLMVAWLVLWACGNYGARKRFLWSFGLTMTALFAGAEFVMPGWLGRFVKAMAAYREYTGRPVSILAVLTTPAVGLFLSGLMLLVLAVVCWRCAPCGSRRSDLCSRVAPWFSP